MSDYIVKLLPKANRDLDEIYIYIWDEIKEVETAKRIVGMLEQAILEIDEMPYRVAIRKNGAFAYKGYRQLFVKNFTIAYRIDKESRTVVIVTIRYTPSSI